MNKITVIKDQIEFELDDDIKINIDNSKEFYEVKKVTLNILKNTTLEINYLQNELKLDLDFILEDDVILNLFELNQDSNIKMKQSYLLNKNSNLNIVKFYDSKNINEYDTANLLGENANINYELNTISNDKQIFNLEINHKNKSTISNVSNKCVNINGNITFNVTGNVLKGMSNSELNQSNRIVTFNNKKCKINPNLCIDEYDVIANHSALIGKFDDEEIFYLQSRGIDYNSSIIMLVKGFLLEGKDDKRLNDIISKYWR